MVYFGLVLLSIGLYFIISGVVFLIRVEGFYNKLHGGGVIDSCGIVISLIGLMFLQDNIFSIAKLFFILFIVFLLNPVSTYAIANTFFKKTSTNIEND